MMLSLTELTSIRARIADAQSLAVLHARELESERRAPNAVDALYANAADCADLVTRIDHEITLLSSRQTATAVRLQK